MKVSFKRLHDAAVLPKAAHPGDALDLSAVGEVILQPNVPTLVKTGWAIELPPDYRAWVTPRSGLALKHGITVANAPGLIDPQYRGEVGVILLWNGHAHNTMQWYLPVSGNKRWVDVGPELLEVEKHERSVLPWETLYHPTGKYGFRIAPGDRIAQLTISRIEPFEISEAEELSTTERGANGFGSSGVSR